MIRDARGGDEGGDGTRRDAQGERGGREAAAAREKVVEEGRGGSAVGERDAGDGVRAHGARAAGEGED